MMSLPLRKQWRNVVLWTAELTEKWQNKAEVNSPSVHPNQIEQWTMRDQVNSGFTLLSRTSLAWQFSTTPTRSEWKPTHTPHETSRKFDKKENKAPTVSLTKFFDKPQNFLVSHYSFSGLPQLWILLLMNSKAYCLRNLMTTLITINQLSRRLLSKPLRPSSFSAFGLYIIHLLCLTSKEGLWRRGKKHSPLQAGSNYSKGIHRSLQLLTNCILSNSKPQTHIHSWW